MPYTVSKKEADQTIAYLSQTRGIENVLSSDSDLLAYGVNKLWIKGKSGKNASYTLYDRAKILEDLDLTEDQFMDLCLLLGCDYTNDVKFKGIGPKTALSLVTKHGSLEQICASGKLGDPQESETVLKVSKLLEIKKIFQLNSEDKHFDENLKISNDSGDTILEGEDFIKINNFLCELKFSEKRIYKVLSELEKI